MGTPAKPRWIGRRQLGLAAVASLTVTVLAACGGSNSASTKTATGGGTFTFGLSSDPGNLDPQASAASNLYQMSFLAYDPLLSIDNSGKIQSQLATAWKVSGKQVVLTMHKAITCSDGSAFTATTAAANVNYIADPKNKSPFAGVFIPAGAKATGDDSTGTVTIDLPSAAPFALNGLAGVPMVCQKAITDRSLLAHKTDGTGPYTLSTAVANDHYTLTKRTGYTWGPNGASTAAAGLPDSINVRIIPNETTAANLLLSGQLNAAAITGPDVQRLQAAKLFAAATPSVSGEMWFNQAAGRPGADQQVRLALTRALDLGQVEKVWTSGRGTPGTTLAANAPVACPGDSVSSALPSFALDAAKAALDSDGWTAGSDGIRTKNGKPLAVTFLYNTQTGAAGSAAAELAAGQWKQLGVKVTMKAQDETAAVNTLFSTGTWDVAWEPLNVSSPDQLVGFMSGPVVPAGENFAHIKDPAYDALVAKAQTMQGAAGCPQWLAADSTLVSHADVIPFANQVQQVFGKNAQFAVVSGELQPTSIRMGG